jgi:hypothetical protein
MSSADARPIPCVSKRLASPPLLRLLVDRYVSSGGGGVIAVATPVGGPRLSEVGELEEEL